MEAKIHKILKNTKVEGPGNRYCIWFQGCSKHCPNCFAKATWNFNAGSIYDCEILLNDIFSTPSIEGVTFLGGEPFEQSEVLEFLARSIKKHGLSVLCFTGKTFEEIKNEYNNILQYIDILIDGEYREEEKDFSRPWVGSKNQRYYFLTQRYKEEIIKQYKNKAEINIDKNGFIFINGMGDFNKFSNLLGMVIRH